MKRLSVLLALALFSAAPGCIYVKTHSTIEPIHMTLDVNLKVQLQKELADAFGDIDAASTTVGDAAPAASSNSNNSTSTTTGSDGASAAKP